MDMLHLQRVNVECIDNSLKVCYNHIIPLILLLAYVKVGLPYAAAVSFSTLLYNMKYYITTSFGLALLAKSFGFLAAVYGIGQGSTDGPPGWTYISDMLLKCYHKIYKGCTIQDP
eukprot:14265107-Ditylum_brightwellii.AAC.1